MTYNRFFWWHISFVFLWITCPEGQADLVKDELIVSTVTSWLQPYLGNDHDGESDIPFDIARVMYSFANNFPSNLGEGGSYKTEMDAEIVKLGDLYLEEANDPVIKEMVAKGKDVNEESELDELVAIAIAKLSKVPELRYFDIHDMLKVMVFKETHPTIMTAFEKFIVQLDKAEGDLEKAIIQRDEL